MLIINMYIAVILENFKQAHEQEEIGITEDYLENFYDVWERYDPHATQFIKYEKLSDFIHELGPPLGMKKPNEKAITLFNLPIITGDLVHCLDILQALTVYCLNANFDDEEFKQFKKEIEKKFLEYFPVRVKTTTIMTTIERKKLEIGVRKFQLLWRAFKLRRDLRILSNSKKNHDKLEPLDDENYEFENEQLNQVHVSRVQRIQVLEMNIPKPKLRLRNRMNSV